MGSIFARRDVARLYRSTRHLPLAASVALLTSIIRHSHSEEVSIADIGCGTGRFARALPYVAGRFSCTAVDLSSAMLSEFARTVSGDRRYELLHADATTKALRSVRARMVLAHWIANTTPRWQELIDSCASIADCEMVVWFEERSPVYECVDGNPTATVLPPFFTALVRRFFGDLADDETARRRPGIHIHDRALQSYVANRGFSRIDHLSPVTWTGRMTAMFFFERFLKPRAFTNLALLPDDRYARALQRVARMLENFPRDARHAFSLPYAAMPVVAARS